MQITLTLEQETWLRTHVARGEFSSLEAAARQLLDASIAAHENGADNDLLWVRPLVDEGLAALDRGDTISLEEHKARNKARLAAMTR